MNFSGVRVCVAISPAVFFAASQRDFGFALEANLKEQGAVVVAPSDYCDSGNPTARLRKLIDGVLASRVLLLLPGWGKCTFLRAAWAAAQYLQISIVYVEQDGQGGFAFSGENAVSHRVDHVHKVAAEAVTTGAPQ